MEKIRKICKIVFLISIFIFSVKLQNFAQRKTNLDIDPDLEEKACDCKDILGQMATETPMGFGSGKTILDWLNDDILPLYNKLALSKKMSPIPEGRIHLLSVDCVKKYGAVAKICKENNSPRSKNIYFIIYNEGFIKKIDRDNGLNVLFVLCHELGHLISNKYYHDVVPIDTNYISYSKIKGKSYQPTIKVGSPIEYMKIKEKHLEEFTADAYAFWLIKKYIEENINSKQKAQLTNKFTIESLKDIFVNFETYISSYCGESDTHPSCERRGIMAKLLLNEKNWKKTENKAEFLRGFVEENYDSTVIAGNVDYSNPYSIRINEKAIGDSVFKAGKMQYKDEKFSDAEKTLKLAQTIYTRLVFPEDTAEVNTALKEVQKILSVRSFMHLSALGNSSFAHYKLKSDGQNIDATSTVGGQLGLRLARYSYINPLSFEVDALYDLEAWQFDTYNTDRKALERFKASTITIQPKITYRFLGFKKSNKTQGFVFSAGASWMNPIKFNYQNFQVPTQDLGIRLKPSWGATVGIGFENINRKPSLNVWGLCRVAIVSTYQPLVFESSQPLTQNYSAAAWTVGLSASVGILPKFLIRRK